MDGGCDRCKVRLGGVLADIFQVGCQKWVKVAYGPPLQIVVTNDGGVAVAVKVLVDGQCTGRYHRVHPHSSYTFEKVVGHCEEGWVKKRPLQLTKSEGRVGKIQVFVNECITVVDPYVEDRPTPVLFKHTTTAPVGQGEVHRQSSRHWVTWELGEPIEVIRFGYGDEWQLLRQGVSRAELGLPEGATEPYTVTANGVVDLTGDS